MSKSSSCSTGTNLDFQNDSILTVGIHMCCFIISKIVNRLFFCSKVIVIHVKDQLLVACHILRIVILK